MALAPSTRYPAQTDTDAGYPQGKARNAGSYQDGTGTPLERDWVNDVWGLLQSLLDDAGLTPSGSPDQVGASQYLEAIEALATRIAIAETYDAIDSALLRLRLVGEDFPFTDTGDGFAMIAGLTDAAPSIAIKASTDDTRYVFDSDDITLLGGSLTSITTAVMGIARNGSRLVAIGSGGNRCCFSTNEGVSWAAGSDLGANPGVGGIIYNPTHSRFLVVYSSGVNVAHDVDGASTWTVVSSGMTSGQGGIAAFSNGDVLVCGLDGASEVDIARSVDGGGTWGPVASPPNPGDYDDSGFIVGDGGATIYHAGRVSSGASLRICSTTSAMVWSLIATITPPAAITGRPRIMLCPDTGLLVVVYNVSGSGVAHASRDGGVTWSAPAFYRARVVQDYALVRGRLFSAFGAGLYATDKLI